MSVANVISLDLSVVIPLYQEEENIDDAVAEVLEVLDGLPVTAEVLLVNDGSRDSTGVKALAWTQQDSRVRLIDFRRNFGQTAAIQAGFDHARGQTVVLMDGDMQNDPRDIGLLLQRMDQGYDVVSGWRKNRQDRAISRKLPSKIANRLISKITGTQLHDYGCTLKAYDIDVVRNLNLYGELHRFIPALAGMNGANVVEVPVNHRPRTRGSSKYGIGRAPRVVLDLLTVKFMLTYLTRPMQFFGKWALASIGIGVGVFLTLLAEKLIAGHAFAAQQLIPVAIGLLLIGVVLFCAGVLAEILMRIYHETGARNSYAVKSNPESYLIASGIGQQSGFIAS